MCPFVSYFSKFLPPSYAWSADTNPLKDEVVDAVLLIEEKEGMWNTTAAPDHLPTLPHEREIKFNLV
jgi:hypothetical protein